MTVEALLAKTRQEQIDLLLSFTSEQPFGATREGLMEIASAAAASKFEWGWQLANELRDGKLWKTDLWSAILRAWTSTELNDDEWRQVLTLIDGLDSLHTSLATEIGNLLEEGIKRPSKPIPDDCLEMAGDSLGKTVGQDPCRQRRSKR